MITRLAIENFWSIRDAQVISLPVKKVDPDRSERFASIPSDDTVNIPKVVALFGANASGKSNVLRALAFLKWFIKQSFFLKPSEPLLDTHFLDADSKNRPTYLAVDFWAIGLLNSEAEAKTPIRYRYEVRIGNAADRPSWIAFESLRHWPVPGGRARRIFERDENGRVVGSPLFSLAGFGAGTAKIRPNASTVSTLGQFNHPVCISFLERIDFVIENIFIEKFDYSPEAVTNYYAQNPATLHALNEEISRIDLGIDSVKIEDFSGKTLAFFAHEGLDSLIPMHRESHGTRCFVQLFPLLNTVLRIGGVAVVDELDIAIHPLILPEVLRWFYDPVRNPFNAQLWITCQTASLLDELSKEQVLFCEKDQRGATSVYGLKDFRGLKKSDSYYRRYLGSVYGAVPRIG